MQLELDFHLAEHTGVALNIKVHVALIFLALFVSFVYDPKYSSLEILRDYDLFVVKVGHNYREFLKNLIWFLDFVFVRLLGELGILLQHVASAFFHFPESLALVTSTPLFG